MERPLPGEDRGLGEITVNYFFEYFFKISSKASSQIAFNGLSRSAFKYLSRLIKSVLIFAPKSFLLIEGFFTFRSIPKLNHKLIKMSNNILLDKLIY